MKSRTSVSGKKNTRQELFPKSVLWIW